MIRFALAGNPNCGKTTLFYVLTGSTAHTGNWPGVTVDRKDGLYKKFADITVTITRDINENLRRIKEALK